MTVRHALAHERVVAPGVTTPARWIAMAHGVFGRGRNWAGVARPLVAARREWGALLVDLRLHGASGEGSGPPHTVARCADDLAETWRAIGIAPSALLGHSFGAKIALVHAASRARPASLAQVWAVDAPLRATPPGGEGWKMLATLRALPPEFASRDEAIRLLEDAGCSRAVATWMATNVVAAEQGRWRLSFDLDAIEAVLRNWYATDVWPLVETAPPGVEVHVLRAESSEAIPEADAARIPRLHRLAGGHWLNAENPGAVAALLAATLP